MPLTVQTLMPAVVTPNSQVIVTDIDNDGLIELIILDGDLQQLSVVHQFSYSDYTLNGINSTEWPDSDPDNTKSIWSDSTPRWQTLWTAQQGVVSNPQGSDSWKLRSGDAIIAADLNGDGTNALFIYNLFYAWWGVLKWQSGQLQMIYQIQLNSDIVPIGQIEWTVSVNDQYFIVPNFAGIISNPAVSATTAGILAYNSETFMLGMFSYSYSDGQFLQWWRQWWLSGWTLRKGDQFYADNFADATKPSLVVYNPSDHYIALLSWDGTQFTTPSAQGGKAGNWNFESEDKIQSADLNADGIAEILIYNYKTQYLGVLQWQNGTLESLAVSNGTITNAPYSWQIGGSDKPDQYYCLDVGAGSPAQIYAFSPSSLQVAVLIYQKGGFVCQWSGSSLALNSGWPVTATDSFYVGLPAESTAPRFFTLSSQQLPSQQSNQGSNQGSNPSTSKPTVPMFGAATWTETLQIVSSAQVPVQAWSPAFLGAAPVTNFSPFPSTDQQNIYTYLSQLFPVPALSSSNKQPPTSVRALYSNLDNQGYFQSYVGALANVNQSPSQVPTTGWLTPPVCTDKDWQLVVKQIMVECTQVTGVYSMYQAMGEMASSLNGFQSGDLTEVKRNIKKAAQGTSSALEYWLGQFFVAALWGFSASAGLFTKEAGEAAGFGVYFATLASLAGSVSSYDPTHQKSYAAKDMEVVIAQTFEQSIITSSNALTATLGDPVKLNICYGLLENDWQMGSSLPSTLPAFSVSDRLYMYQTLMPFHFTIVIENAEPGRNLFYVFLNNEFYFLRGGSYITESEYQTLDLFQDLFTTIGVPVDEFFLGIGAWAAMPRTTFIS